ncbi:VOC family protein [Amycolatopsis sp. 195334CR]|uniref:VOC family protein n=1 Tax=Amycolatopsis sp. 195334CR TaxID=2814588 RepID=UPI001A8C2CAD|nr:VOC family protein [Amycolatopsis sp. 195334CR]MBN6038114.1 VOC family protein [Amycolatopsis sp. 195334CR]
MTEPLLDHLVYAGPDIDALVASFTEQAGVAPVLGGRHVGRGTRNYLTGLGGNAYLELIGPDDPRAPKPATFGIDRLTGPKLAAWVVRPADIEHTVAQARKLGYDPGDIGPLSRRTPEGTLLEWRLTPNRGDRFGGLAPALIDWLDAPHPTTNDLPVLPLVSLRGTHPDPDAVRGALDALDVELDLTEGTPALEAVLDTPNGRITLR